MNPSLFSSSFSVNLNLIRQFGRHCADYRLYPQIEYFDESFDAHAYVSWLNDQKTRYFRKSLSLYVYIPFGSAECLCRQFHHIILRNDQGGVEKYLFHLNREIELQARLFEDQFKVEQIYIGGGAPNCLSNEQLHGIIEAVQRNFNVVKEKELYLEIDAGLTNAESMLQFKKIGFNCAIIGVQAFNPSVQQPPHVQAEDRLFSTLRDAQNAGFRTIRVEVFYGMPQQTLEHFLSILDHLIAVNPSQIQLLNYAHFPAKLEHQQEMTHQSWRNEETAFEMLIAAITYLTGAGYVHIGMNLFASRHDELVMAQRQGRLYYGLQGYSIHPDCTRLALGPCAIGSVGAVFYQNYCDLQAYHDKLEHHTLPIMHGLELNADDLIRRSVMQALICHSILSYESVETFFSIEFKRYFAPELAELRRYEQADLIALNDEEIAVTPAGQLWVGSICRVFDRYLRAHSQRKDYLLQP